MVIICLVICHTQVDAMLQNLEKEIDDVDAKIGDRWRLLDRCVIIFGLFFTIFYSSFFFSGGLVRYL